MDYRIEIRDREFNFVTVLDKRAYDISWDYNAIGGCGAFRFAVPSKYCTELDLGANFNVQIKRRNPDTDNYDLWYQGRIENKEQGLTGQASEIIQVSGYGYQSQLRDLYIQGTFSSQEVSSIVTTILGNTVTPNTDITYSGGDIENTGYTVNSLTFDYVDLLQVFQTLSELGGNVEWGVDRNRKFFFKQKSQITGFRYPVGNKLSNVVINDSSREIITRVIVQGSGTFIYQKDYTKAQAKYMRRDRVLQRSSIANNTDAEQLADAVQNEKKGVVRRARCQVVEEKLFENTTPLGLFEILTREVTYDEKKYDTFLYAGVDPFRIKKIGYTIDKTSQVVSELNLGEVLPSNVEKLRQLEFSIDQVRSS